MVPWIIISPFNQTTTATILTIITIKIIIEIIITKATYLAKRHTIITIKIISLLPTLIRIT